MSPVREPPSSPDLAKLRLAPFGSRHGNGNTGSLRRAPLEKRPRWFYEALTGQTEVSFGPMAGRHKSLKKDFATQCVALRNELQDHFSTLVIIAQQVTRLK